MKDLIRYLHPMTAALALWYSTPPASAVQRPFDSEFILRPGDNAPAFGSLVAIDGDTAVVSDALGSGSGVYIFTRNGCDWVQQVKIPLFVSSIAISGNTIAAGGTTTEHVGQGPGEVHIYVRNAGVWTEEQVIPAPGDHIGGADTAQFFGVAVGLWVNTLVVGDPGDEENGTRSGAAFIYRRECGKWIERAKLTDPNEQAGDLFGFAVSIDKYRTIIGAPDGGYADIFMGSGPKWRLQAHLKPDDAMEGSFGRAVDIRGVDAVVGDPGCKGAFVYRLSGKTWKLTTTLSGNDTQVGDGFGWSVGVYGSVIVTGAPFEGDHGNNAGAAYTFSRRGQTWSQLQKIVGSDTGANDEFGIAAAISGKNIVIGRARASLPESGEAYVYTSARCCCD